jgi:hypothetical protein
MMVLPKYGIHKKENFNILFKLIQTTQNSAEREIISFREDLRNQSISGNVDFMIQ